MRLLYVCLDRGIPIGGTKGASIHVAELVRAFEEQGHEVGLVARSVADCDRACRLYRARASARNRWFPGRTLRRDLSEVRSRGELARAVREATADFRPDAVYERYALFRSDGLETAQAAGLPFVLEVNAPLTQEERRFRSLALRRTAERIEQQVWRGADLVIAPSHAVAQLVRGSGQPCVLVVPNAVDPERFAPRAGSGELRRRLGIDDRFVVGFAGSLKPWHDLETLVDAVGALREDHAATLLFLGDGPLRRTLEARGASRGVRAVFVGCVPHDEVPDFLGATDVCFAGLTADPRLHYFSPLKALEYLAAGRPTVVAAAGELRSLVEADVVLAYQPGDAAGLATSLARLAADPELATTLAERGRAYAAQRTWHRAARTIADAIEELGASKRSFAGAEV